MEHLDKATAVATWFDSFLKHGSSISILLSLFFGWGFSILMSFPIHRKTQDAELATFYARVCCVVGSFLITAITWTNDFRWAWAATMGVLSPLIGLLVLLLLKKWKPDLYEALSMKKITPIANEVEHDVRPSEPRSDTH